jgi:rod shape-determining protein MreC
MFDSSHEFTGPTQPLTRESGEAMQAFVARHRAFFVLLAVMLAQLLLLSVQITRSHNLRLIQVWTVAVFNPFERSVHWALGGARNTWNRWAGLRNAQVENAELRRELAGDQTRLQQLSDQAAQAESLRALLDLKKSLPMETVAAEVIATSPGERSGAVFIDKGNNAGLKTDWAVITPSGIVGKIVAVFHSTAQIMLITDPSSGVGCMLEKSRVQGVLKGGSQAFPELHYIRNEESVAVGDRVVTSGLDQIYPPGLPVGMVVQTRHGDIYQNVLVKPAAPLDRLEAVLVVKKPFPPEPPAANTPPHP